MNKINIHEAKTHLSRLVDQVAKAGKPMVMVVPLDQERKPVSRRGFMAGQFTVPDDFDTMFADEIAAMFEGEE